MNARNCVAAYVCIAATGEKVTMCSTGNGKNPKCFRFEWHSKSNTYLHKRMHGHMHPLSNNGFTHSYFFICRQTYASVALGMDNRKSCGTGFIDPNGQVSIFPLQPIHTAIHQKIDSGIISARKAHFRQLLVKEIVLYLEAHQPRPDNSHVLKAVTRGSDGGHALVYVIFLI